MTEGALVSRGHSVFAFGLRHAPGEQLNERLAMNHDVRVAVLGKENPQEIDGYAKLSQTEAGNLLRHIGNQHEPLPALLTPELLLVEAAGIHMPADSISTKSGESRSSQTSASTRPFMGEGIVCGKLEQLHRKVRTRCSVPRPSLGVTNHSMKIPPL